MILLKSLMKIVIIVFVVVMMVFVVVVLVYVMQDIVIEDMLSFFVVIVDDVQNLLNSMLDNLNVMLLEMVSENILDDFIMVLQNFVVIFEGDV